MSRDDRPGFGGTGFAIGLAAVALLLTVMWIAGCGPSSNGGSLIMPGFRFFGPLSVWGILQAILAVWVGLDAGKRGLNGILWGLLVFFTGVVGLIVYLLVGPVMQRNNTETARPDSTPAAAPTSPRCPGCNQRVDPQFKVCPYCAKGLRCRSCDKTIDAGWKVCPYCTAPVEPTS